MSYHPVGVIPVEAGIQKRKTLDARLRISGMTTIFNCHNGTKKHAPTLIRESRAENRDMA